MWMYVNQWGGNFKELLEIGKFRQKWGDSIHSFIKHAHTHTRTHSMLGTALGT